MPIPKLRFLNANAIKILACILMVIDHVGFFLGVPNVHPLRIIGRLSLPLFAFTIAEGCRYTKNKLLHFGLLGGLALVVQVVYYLFDGSLYMCILVTFTFSVVCIYALQFFKKTLFSRCKWWWKVLAVLPFILAVALTYVANQHWQIDYGFWGCMLPVFASIFDFHRIPAPAFLKEMDNLPLRVLCFCIGLILLAMYPPALREIQFFSLFAMPILLLYNGKKGKWNIKYFFYVFYPVHMVILQGIMTYLL